LNAKHGLPINYVETESQFTLLLPENMPDERPSEIQERLPLTELPAGVPGRVAELSGQKDFCQRLREMGFCESSIIQRIAGKDMLICQLCGTRVALSDRAAQLIMVEPIRGGA
jgi:ferrous iron transport protein A